MKTLALSAVLVFACGARADFTGTWDTNYGPVTMIQRGDRVTGTYYDGTASLRGRVQGCRMTLSYRETSERGEARFELAPDGNSFTGRYRAAGTQNWVDWCGTRR
jgi:hypothetical protein